MIKPMELPAFISVKPEIIHGYIQGDQMVDSLREQLAYVYKCR